MSDKVTTEERGAVRILRINRESQRNCVDGETAVGLGRAIEAFAADERARVLVVTGAGALAVCAGADLKNSATLMVTSGRRSARRSASRRARPSRSRSRSRTVSATRTSRE